MIEPEAPSLGKQKINPKWKVAIIQSAWYPECAGALTDSACETLVRAGLKPGNIRIIVAPGSFELPLFCVGQLVITAKTFDRPSTKCVPMLI